MKLYDQLKPRLVIAENIAQTAQFVESGNAQLGLISLTAASTEHFKQLGSFVRIPPAGYPEIRQCAVVMQKSAHRADAHAFWTGCVRRQSSRAWRSMGSIRRSSSAAPPRLPVHLSAVANRPAGVRLAGV